MTVDLFEAGLIFNEQKRECDYLSDDQLAMLNNTYCSPPKTVLRPKPKADGTLMFNGNDVTGKFPTKFTCEQKPQQLMYNDDDWCNIYHVCAGPRDNIFICPPGTVFSKEKQGCFDRCEIIASISFFFLIEYFLTFLILARFITTFLYTFITRTE